MASVSLKNLPEIPFPTLLSICLLNAIPVVGVLFWGWKSFDLIFLYWLENVIIGIFMLLRMIIKPYKHPLELLAPLFLLPFFTVHYGMFCTVHGIFVFSLFGPDERFGHGFLEVYQYAFQLLDHSYLLLAVLSLVLLQLYYWIEDIWQSGFGSMNIKNLMTGPYRRIIVLHMTIILSGFALAAMEEPLAGLVLLVLLKTLMDLFFWKLDTAGAEKELSQTDTLTDEDYKKLAERYPEPRIAVKNGEDIVFDSFLDLKNSSQYRMMMAVLRMMGQGRDLKKIDAYMNMRIESENKALKD